MNRTRNNQISKIIWMLTLVMSLPCFAQTDLQTFFKPEELGTLERLVSAALANDAAVLEAQAALGVEQTDLTFEGRLLDALTIGAATDLSTDFYGQVSPSVNVSVALDVVSLLDAQDETTILTAQLEAVQRQTRVAVVAAFTRYHVALETAKGAALSVESAEAGFRVVQARFDIGEATLSDELAAQETVSESALDLLRANAEVINALEGFSRDGRAEPRADPCPARRFMMQAVSLELIGDTWFAKFHDAPAVVQAFGSAYVETPYKAWHDPEWVLVEVLIVLEDCVITLERSSEVA